jgi:hypothetical protein
VECGQAGRRGCGGFVGCMRVHVLGYVERAPCLTAIAAFDDCRVNRKFYVRGLSKICAYLTAEDHVGLPLSLHSARPLLAGLASDMLTECPSSAPAVRQE